MPHAHVRLIAGADRTAVSAVFAASVCLNAVTSPDQHLDVLDRDGHGDLLCDRVHQLGRGRNVLRKALDLFGRYGLTPQIDNHDLLPDVYGAMLPRAHRDLAS